MSFKKLLGWFVVVIAGMMPALAAPAFSLISANADGTLRGPTNFLGTNLIVRGRTYTNVAEMIAAPSIPSGALLTVLGYYTANDGGGGQFVYDATSTTTTNLGTSFAYGTGRLLAILDQNQIDVRRFGAKPNDSLSDSTAFQSALDWRDTVSGKATKVVVGPGLYKVTGLRMTAGVLEGAGHVDRGSDVVPQTTAILEHELGATSDLLTVGKTNGAAGGPSATIRNLLFLGHPEYNIRNPVTITAVYPGDRLHFDVASAPVIEGGKGGPPYLGFAAVFDDSNHFLGSFCLQSFITNGSGSTVTNTVNIMPQTDGYATVNGESILRVGFKVCFPESAEWFSYGTSLGKKAFSSRAGYSGLVLWDSDQSNLEDLKFVNWHTGIVVASPGYTMRNIETYNCHLSGMIAEPMGFLADNTSYGFLLFNGKYQIDDAISPSVYSVKNALYRSSALGFAAVGAQAKHGDIVAGPSAIYGLLSYGGVNAHFDDLLIESPALHPVYVPVGNSGSPQTTTTANRLRIMGGYSGDIIPDNRPTNLALINIGTDGAGLSVGQLTVGQFTKSGYATNWTWAYIYSWPQYATNTGLIAIGNFVDPNRMVEAENPGGTTYQQAWNMLGGTTVTGGAASQPIMTWQRNIAEPNAAKVGITVSAGAKLLFPHDGDGLVNDVGFTFESTSSATQITAGNNSGAASPRPAIIQGEPATGSDVSGGILHIRTGKGKGNGQNAAIYFYTPTVEASGSTNQSDVARLILSQGGHLTFAGMASDPVVGTQTGGLYFNNNSNVFRVNLGAGWKAVRTATLIKASATLNFPSTAAQSESALTISAPGAVVGDVVHLGVPDAATTASSCYSAWVSAADTVTVRFSNYGPSVARDPASGVFTVAVEQY